MAMNFPYTVIIWKIICTSLHTYFYDFRGKTFIYLAKSFRSVIILSANNIRPRVCSHVSFVSLPASLECSWIPLNSCHLVIFFKSEVSATGTNPSRLAVLSPYENKPIATGIRWTRKEYRTILHTITIFGTHFSLFKTWMELLHFNNLSITIHRYLFCCCFWYIKHWSTWTFRLSLVFKERSIYCTLLVWNCDRVCISSYYISSRCVVSFSYCEIVRMKVEVPLQGGFRFETSAGFFFAKTPAVILIRWCCSVFISFVSEDEVLCW